ncbi:MAG: hypothetical protein WA693_10135, partial [Pseudolabrys sp.]
ETPVRTLHGVAKNVAKSLFCATGITYCYINRFISDSSQKCTVLDHLTDLELGATHFFHERTFLHIPHKA